MNSDVTWSVAGDDGSKFDVSDDTGELTFKAKPDFEAPTDAGREQRIRGDGAGPPTTTATGARWP